MTYKTVLTVLTDPQQIPQMIETASVFADEHRAHLEVLCLGVDLTQMGFFDAGIAADVLSMAVQKAQSDALEIETAAKAALKSTSVYWSTSTAISSTFETGRVVAGRARYADVVIIAQPHGNDDELTLEAALEGALFEGQTPVIVVPKGFQGAVPTSRIVLAWNESSEALTATRAAVPLLAGADDVHVTIIDPPQHGPSRSDPGGQISQFLARHGARVEIDVLSKTLPTVSEVLVRHCGDVDADMVVMGAYGHSRFREAVLGGATRNMLRATPVPAFLAH